MKKVLLVFFFSLNILSIYASSTIKGKVIDENTQQPISYATIAIFGQGKKTPSYGGVSDINGLFEINTIPSGKYTLQISFIGYHIYNRNLTVDKDGSNIAIGTIQLKEDAQMLNEVEVVGMGSQMRFEIDKKVFSVDQSISAAGGSATEVLENIPSVEVDQDGNISLRSNESVEVWINGKPSGLTAENRAQILQQMPAENIESIEVITNPSAKYNPEGTAGIINLVLKKKRKSGYYGNVTAGITYPDGGTLGGNIGASINYSSSKIDAYANIGYRRMSRKGGSWSNLWIFNETDSLIHQENDNSSFHGGFFGRVGIDYYINDKSTLSLSGFGMSGGGETNSILSSSEKNLETDIIERFYNRNISEESDRSNFNISLDYKYEFDKKGSELLANISYSGHNNKGENNYLQKNLLTELNESNTIQNSSRNNNNLQIKVDYTHIFAETSKIETGLQSNIQKRNSQSEGFDKKENIEIEEYYNVFDYKEQIHAAYITYSKRFFNRLSLQLGLRGEYMWRDGNYEDINKNEDINYNSYFELFPSFFASYVITKKDEIQLNYTRRVNRPRGWQINPFRDYSDPKNISFGNEKLNPEFSSAFELNYLRNWGVHSLSTSLYYRFTDNLIQRVRYRTLDNMESTFMNISKSNNTGLEVISKNRLTRFLNLTTSINLYHKHINSASYTTPYNKTEFIKEEKGFSWDGSVIGNIMLSSSFSGQITGRYRSPMVIAQGRHEANYSIDLGLRKSFFNRNLNLSFNIRDVLNSRSRKSHTFGEGFEQYTESYWHGRSFGLTVSFNFGNMQSKQNTKKDNQNGSNNMDIDMEIMD